MSEISRAYLYSQTIHLPIVNVTLNSYLALNAVKHRHVIEMVTPHTREIRCLVDVVWYDLSVTFTMGMVHT